MADTIEIATIENDEIIVSTITGAKGDQGIQGERGEKGERGQRGERGERGEQGFSPLASVAKVGGTATITITDIRGTTTAIVKDGSDASITIDDTLSGTSENAVQNKVIYNQIGNIETILATLNNGGGAQ